MTFRECILCGTKFKPQNEHEHFCGGKCKKYSLERSLLLTQDYKDYWELREILPDYLDNCFVEQEK